ncbi:MAG: hypothetical protein QM689_08715 [Oscillospiraceae bacterium]
MIKRFKNAVNRFIHGKEHWKYSFSLSLFLTGCILMIIAVIQNYMPSSFLSSFIILVGALFYPNLKPSVMDAIGKAVFKFTISFVGIVMDIFCLAHIFENKIKLTDEIFLYIVTIMLTLFLARYYIDIIYRVIFVIIQKSRNNSEKLKTVWKVALAALGFLVTLASLVNIAIGIQKAII